MIFAKMDVTLRDHAKLIKAIGKVGWGALGVYAWAMMYLRAAETEDGVLADDVVELSMPNQKDTKKIIAALVDVGLLVRRDAGGGSGGGGYYLDKYETKNETKAVIAERRAATAERVTRYRGVRNGVTGPSVTLLHPQTENAFVPGSDSDSVLRSDQGVQGGMAPLPSDAQVTPALRMIFDGVVMNTGARLEIDREWGKFKSNAAIKLKVSGNWTESWRVWLGDAAMYAKRDALRDQRGSSVRPDPPKPPSHKPFTPLRRVP